MVPPDRSIPRLNPVKFSGSFRYARATSQVAIRVGIRQMIVRVKKVRRIVPPGSVHPASLAGGTDCAEPRAARRLLGVADGRVARGDPGDRTLEHPDAGVGRVVHPEGDL